MVLSATLCCGCGICESLACSQGISPKAVINNYKKLLAKNKMRYSTNYDVEPREERDYRLIPSEKWESTLGVTKYDRVASYGGEISGAERAIISLNRHIGAPSVPCVKSGELVKRGQIIAAGSEGLSVPQHASIDGRVTVTDMKIIIDRI